MINLRRKLQRPIWMGEFVRWLLWSLLGIMPVAGAGTNLPPNIIVVLVDDLGWADLGCYGNRFHETPHLDALAGQGVRFTSAYSACTVCSPTRASLLTGKYPARLHLTDWIAGHPRPHARLRVPPWTQQLPAPERTLPEALHPAGYVSASIGKWHLGGPGSYPEQHGFDLNAGGYERGQPPSYHSPYRIPTLPEDPPGRFLTERETDDATTFIQTHRAQPFLLYLPHYAVHTPLAGKADVIAKYQAKRRVQGGTKNPVYAALLESVDDAMGRLRGQLKELQLEDRTIIVFTSDNGGLILGGTNAPTSNLPLRSGKGSPYEGGVRVPLIVYWPGNTPAGSICEAPVITPDLYATILGWAGVKPVAGQQIDGRDLRVLLQNPSRVPRQLSRRSLFWHYPHYHPGGSTPYGAIRDGRYKLIEYFEDGRTELFDLEADPGEMREFGKDQPRVVTRLRGKLQAWRTSVGAQMPTPNPDYDPKRDRF